MGTPDFAVSILKDILAHNYEVIGVVTAPDKPAGRGRKLKASAVKEFALEQNLNVYQPNNLKSDQFKIDLEAMNPNLLVVVAFRMLPKKVWSFPKFGTFNLHASLLPNYRGAAPIHWAVINNEKQTGVTTFFLDEKIDTGEIILSKSLEISPSESTGEIYLKLMNLGGKAVVETLQKIEQKGSNVKTTPQSFEDEFKEAPKLTKENTKINWHQNGEAIYNQIRGLSPFPLAWSYLKEEKKQLVCKFYASEFIKEKHRFPPGKIILENKTIKIACLDGFIIPKELKLEGKKKMKVKELLNGYQFMETTLFL